VLKDVGAQCSEAETAGEVGFLSTVPDEKRHSQSKSKCRIYSSGTVGS
jgi:hypothetical protein